jgi:hypothetical protein
MAHKVVAHFIDHQVVKGTSLDVDPGKPHCHVRTDEGEIVDVDLSQVKALFFVKDLNGNSKYDEVKDPASGDNRLRGSTLIDITFVDGEKLGVLTNRYPPRGVFFFAVPMDPKSNNIRILINRDAIASMEARDAQTPASQPPARPKRTSWVFDGKDIKEVFPER